MKTIEMTKKLMQSEKGGLAGYGVAWLLGVPLSVLVVIFLIFGR